MPVVKTASPDELNALSAEILTSAVGDAPEPHPIPESTMTLPGGLFDPLTGDSERDALVRELNGEDEEYLARVIGDPSKLLDAILVRGVESIGGRPVTPAQIEALLMADRDALLLAIRKVTFGDVLTLYGVTCQRCDYKHDEFNISLNDIPSPELIDGARTFPLTLPSGKVASVTLPTGDVQVALAKVVDRNKGKLNTLLLSHIVRSINGSPSIGEAPVKALGLRDRDFIVEEVGKRNPGPRLLEVTSPCERCQADIPVPLTLAVLFRL